MPLATDLGKLKDLKFRLQQTFLASWSIWMPLLQQKLQIEGSELASYKNRLCELWRIWMPFCNRSSVTNWRIQMPLATEMSRKKVANECSWVVTHLWVFAWAKTQKPWSLDLQWGKIETWVSLQVGERERENQSGRECAWDYTMDEWMSNFMQFLLESWFELALSSSRFTIGSKPINFFTPGLLFHMRVKPSKVSQLYLYNKNRDYFSRSLYEW
jgi:hypothetical protein